MKQVTIFENNLFGEVRFTEIEGKPYAVANDILEALGYSKGSWRTTLNRKCKGVTKCNILTNGGKQEINLIPEGDIYRLIVGSKLPQAQKFEKWVFDEVLPQIRKTGGYIPVKEEDDDFTILAKAVQILQKTVERKDELIDKLEQQVEVFGMQAPFTINKVAGIHSMTPKQVEKLLYEEGWIKWNEAGKKVIINNRYLMYTPEGKPGRPGILFTEAGVKAFHYKFRPRQ